MLTKEQVLEAVRGGRKSKCLDGRDYSRLSSFFPVDQWKVFGISLKDDADTSKVTAREWSRDNILEILTTDVEFGFEKALNQRGISANLMHECVKLWLWILEDDLHEQADETYAYYGLPLFKAVAIKYGLPDEIVGFEGDDPKFEEC